MSPEVQNIVYLHERLKKPFSVFLIVQRIISREMAIKPNRITPKATLVGLGIDSLDFIGIVVALETEFNLYISDKEAQKFVTVQDVLNYIEQYTKLSNIKIYLALNAMPSLL